MENAVCVCVCVCKGQINPSGCSGLLSWGHALDLLSELLNSCCTTSSSDTVFSRYQDLKSSKRGFDVVRL